MDNEIIFFWIVQSLGIIGLIFYGVSFQMKTKEKLLLVQVMSNIFVTVQFLLLMALTGAVQTLIGVIRGIVFYFFKKKDLKPNIAVLIIFEIAIILGTVFTWENILSILPLIGMTVNLYGQWQDNMKTVRICAIISGVLWSIYAFNTGVYTAVLNEILKISSSLIGLWRYRKINETQK